MLEARSLTKYYQHTAAVRGVSFRIEPGEILGYLGPNGAGKSTTVKMLTGLIEPSAGQIVYQGRSVYDDLAGFQRRLGYVPEEAHLYPHLSGREYLQLGGRLRGIERKELESKTDNFLQLFGLWDDRHDPLSAYSKGMRQKIMLSAALLHDPDILILDEPFSGLDVTSAMVLRSLIRGLAQQGKIILYSSHVLEVVEKVCSQVLILRKGEVAAYDSIDRLRDLMKQPSLEAVFAQLAQTEDSDAVAGRILDAMNQKPAPPRKRAAEAGIEIGRKIVGAMPQEFRNAHGGDVLQIAEDAMEPVWRRDGVAGIARLLFDLAIRVPAEYLAEMRRDFVYAFRMLRQSPGFTAAALISLALGACIATSAISEMNGMIWRDTPLVAHPRELAAIQLPVSYPDYKRYRDRTEVFSTAMAYVAPAPFTFTRANGTERLWGQLVTPSYFATLGVRPFAGSFFDARYDQPGQPPAVVVSYRFWQSQLGADPSAVGRSLRLNGEAATLVGVGPPEFLGASPIIYPADVWLPVSTASRVAPELAGNGLERRDRQIFRVVGRLKPGVSAAAAEAALDMEARHIEEDNGVLDRARRGRRVTLLDGGKQLPLRKQDKPFFTSFFLLIAGLMVLIPCVNVANMMLARAAQRRREIAVRLAMGASRARLVRQLLTESMLLAMGAGALGFAGSAWLMRALSHLKMAFASPAEYDFRPDARVALWALLLTVLAGLAFGLAPALEATRNDILPALKQGGTVMIFRKRRWNGRNLLIVSQMAGTLTLLTVLGFESFGIQTTLGIERGFEPRNLFLLTLDPARDGIPAARAAVLLDRVLERAQALPAVRSASLSVAIPVAFPDASIRLVRPGAASGSLISAAKHVVGRGYFATAGIRMESGREFRREEESPQAAKVIVSEALAREFWPGQDAVGRMVELGDNPSAAAGGPGMLPAAAYQQPGAAESGRRVFEVVGVAADLGETLTVQRPRPAIYFPLTTADYAHASLAGVSLMVRAAPGTDVLTPLAREVTAADGRLTSFDGRPMQEQVDRFMAPLRAASRTYTVMWVFGLLLAAVGLAGVTGYSVAQRRKEIAIRLAVGARRSDVLGLVMRDGAILTAAGIAAGIVAAAAATRLLAAMNATAGQMMTSTSTSNPVILAGVPALLAALALLSCYLPALQSLRIDPVSALRQE